MRAREKTQFLTRSCLGLAAIALALGPSAVPGAQGAPLVDLDFGAPVSGTVEDKDGQGTGFSGVLPNSPGGAHVPAELDLRPGPGLLDVTTTEGDARWNWHRNAL